MKIGMALSGAILLLLVGALYLKTRPGGPDAATDASSEANLALQTLPDDLPSFGLTTSNDATDTQALFTVLARNQGMLTGGGFEDEKPVKAREVVTELKQVAAGKVKPGYLDAKINDKAFNTLEAVKPMQALAKAVSVNIEYAQEDGDFDAAHAAASAYLHFGRQTFENNTRLKSRQSGLAIVRSALSKLSQIAYAAKEDGAISDDAYSKRIDDVQQWMDAIKKLDDAWNVKLQSIDTIAPDDAMPNTADLIKIANEDKDLTFRVFAARRLGYALFERTDAGNQQAINAALDALEKSTEPMVAAAAKGGRSIKDADEYHELRKY